MNTKKVVFVGSKALGATVLNEMYSISPDSIVGVITIDDTNDSRCALNLFREFEKRTKKKLLILQKGSELASAIKEFQPDLCIVVGWYWVLKPDLLNAVPDGWLGIHASLLPKNRGGAPLVWSIINGEKKTGLSLFYFDNGMDTGDIVAQKEIAIDFMDTISEILNKINDQSIKVINEYYLSLLEGTAPRKEQNHDLATYISLRNPSDGKIDWNQSAIEIYNFIRAQTHPYPGAFCLVNEKKIRIWSSEPFKYPYFGNHGQVVLIENDFIVVTCGKGTGICLKEISLDDCEEIIPASYLKFGQLLS